VFPQIRPGFIGTGMKVKRTEAEEDRIVTRGPQASAGNPIEVSGPKISARPAHEG